MLHSPNVPYIPTIWNTSHNYKYNPFLYTFPVSVTKEHIYHLQNTSNCYQICFYNKSARNSMFLLLCLYTQPMDLLCCCPGVVKFNMETAQQKLPLYQWCHVMHFLSTLFSKAHLDLLWTHASACVSACVQNYITCVYANTPDLLNCSLIKLLVIFCWNQQNSMWPPRVLKGCNVCYTCRVICVYNVSWIIYMMLEEQTFEWSSEWIQNIHDKASLEYCRSSSSNLNNSYSLYFISPVWYGLMA